MRGKDERSSGRCMREFTKPVNSMAQYSTKQCPEVTPAREARGEERCRE